jgi:hypothetical protein
MAPYFLDLPEVAGRGETLCIQACTCPSLSTKRCARLSLQAKFTSLPNDLLAVQSAEARLLALLDRWQHCTITAAIGDRPNQLWTLPVSPNEITEYSAGDARDHSGLVPVNLITLAN